MGTQSFPHVQQFEANTSVSNSRLSQSSNITSADIYDVIPYISIRTNVTQKPDAAGTTMNMHTTDNTETSVIYHYYYYNYQLRIAAFKAYCAIWIRRSNFRHQASPRVSPRESTQRRKVELWARNVREFCLNADLHVTFRDLLHAVKLRHGTDGFTSPPKEGVLRIFSP